MIYDWLAEFQMARRFLTLRRKGTVLIGLCLLGGLGLMSDRVKRDPRLIAYDPLPPDDMEDCTNPAASSGFSLIAGELPLRTILMQTRIAAGTAAASPLDASQRQPVRMIRDPYAAYSAVEV